VAPFFSEAPEYDEDAVSSVLGKEGAKKKLEDVIDRFSELSDFSAPALEDCVRKLAAESGLKAADLIHPIRVAITGRKVGASLFETVALVGKDMSMMRLRSAAEKAKP